MVVVEVGGLGLGGTQEEALRDDRTGHREVERLMDNSRDMGKVLVCTDSLAEFAPLLLG